MPVPSRFACFALLASLAVAPAGAAPWSRAFGTARTDDARAVAAMGDGGVAVVAEASDDPSHEDTSD